MAFFDCLTSVFLTGILVIVPVKIALMILNTRKFNRQFKDLPQSPSHPLFGHAIEFPGPNDVGLAYLRDLVARLPRFHTFWLGTLPVVYVNHPDLVKIVLKSSEPKDAVYRFLHPWLGQGLLTSNGERWARSRRLLTPAFHFDILKGYLQMENDLCNDLLDKFEHASSTGSNLSVFDCISMFTLDVILQSTMSYETGCQKEGKTNPYIQSVNRLTKMVSVRYFSPWLHPDVLFYMTPAGWRFFLDCRLVHRVTDDIIAKRKKELENKVPAETKEKKVPAETEDNEMKKTLRQDFLDTLITARDEDGNGLTNKEIRDEVDTFLFEGHDTTASAISWCLYSLAEHPDIQARVQEEVDAVFQGRDSDYLLWDDLTKLPYLVMTVKEAMRLHNPVPSFARELTTDMVLDGHTIPTGASINICAYNIHHNPAVWEDSMKFDPERFSPENMKSRDPFAFVPFSAGPRNCIGQNFAMTEIKVALARILHRYEIHLEPSHKVLKFSAMVMKAETGIKINVKSRMPPTRS